ncbi:DUF4212 domain-containing protein [Bacillus alveayuensis]|uniref:DUF4212 domain-containing protein n=1 Tax=Aeribacillus alveayuensis TaxID=279215 RepID=UPI0005CDC32C|nr:sodium/substrate symporter small subunit [Bacillus alveayuensis]
MKQIDKKIADAYFRERLRLIIIFLIIWFVVSFGVVMFAESLQNITVNGFPFHYFMGAQGSVLTFIILLFINAKMSDKIDEKYGISDEKNQQLSAGRTLDH